MRRFGAMPYITPLQSATESSSTPKSVMKTIVGGGCTEDCCDRRGLATRNKTNHKQNIRGDFPAGADVIGMRSNSQKGYYNRGSQNLVGYPSIQESQRCPM